MSKLIYQEKQLKLHKRAIRRSCIMEKPYRDLEVTDEYTIREFDENIDPIHLLFLNQAILTSRTLLFVQVHASI